MIDDEGDLSTLNEKRRLKAIENHKIWVETASEMGCHSIRVNLHGTTDAEKWKATSSESLSKLSDYASDYNVNIIVENHGGLSSDADLLMEVMSLVNKKNCGTSLTLVIFAFQENGGMVMMDVKMNLISTKELKNLWLKHLPLVQNLMCLMKMEMKKK